MLRESNERLKTPNPQEQADHHTETEMEAQLQDLIQTASYLQGEGMPEDAQAFYLDEQNKMDEGIQPLQVKKITVQEYARFASGLDVLPLAGPGLYERMKAKQEDVCIYGGFYDNELQIAMICRSVPAWKLFRWIEAPFGPVMANPLDSSLLVRFIQEIEDEEDSDSLLYLRLESFLEYQKHNQDGSVDYSGFHNKNWRKELRNYRLQPLDLSTGFEPGRQARFAGIIDLAKDESLYKGVPFPSLYVKNLSSLVMKTRRDLFGAMSKAMQQKVLQAQEPYIRVRLLAQNELDLVEPLKQSASEPLDLSFMEAYGHESAMVLVSLDTQEYFQAMNNGYRQAGDVLQEAFQAAKEHPRSSRRQKALFAAMTQMKAWDQEMEKVEKLKRSRTPEVPLAAGLYLFNPTETLCLWSSSNPAYKHLPGLEAMHWFMLDWSRSRHALRYTFWGLSGLIKPGEEGYENFALSRDFGARLAEFSGAFMTAFKPGSTKAYQTYLKSRNLQ